MMTRGKIATLTAVAAVLLAGCASAVPQPTVVTVTSTPPPATPTPTATPEPTAEEPSAYDRGYKMGYRRTTGWVLSEDWCDLTEGISLYMIETLARRQIDVYSGQTKTGFMDGMLQATKDACR